MARISGPGFLALLLTGGLLAACPNAAHAVTLVEKGQPRAVIILPEKPSPGAERAARVLRDHVKQMSGAELPILTDSRERIGEFRNVMLKPNRRECLGAVGRSEDDPSSLASAIGELTRRAGRAVRDGGSW